MNNSLINELECCAFAEWCYCNYRFNQTVNEWQSNTTLKIFTTKQLINEYKITRK